MLEEIGGAKGKKQGVSVFGIYGEKVVFVGRFCGHRKLLVS